MRKVISIIVCLFVLCVAQAQTNKEQQVLAIKEKLDAAQKRVESDGQSDYPHKVMEITLHDEGGYGGKIKDVLHLYFYEDDTYAEDGALQVTNKPYLIVRECRRGQLTVEELYLFEINNTGEMRDDPLIFAYSKETRDSEVIEKGYFWSNGNLIHAEVEQGRLVEDEDMKQKGDLYYKAFGYVFADIDTHCY